MLINASLDDERVQIARIAADTLDPGGSKVSSTLALGEVIREAANLGASYPEIVAILEAAERQRNLPGPLVIDAVPAPSDSYEKAQLAGESLDGKKDKDVKRTSTDDDRARWRLFRFFRRDRSEKR